MGGSARRQGRQLLSRRQHRQLRTAAVEEGIGADQQRIGSAAGDLGECRVDLGLRAGLDHVELEPQRVGALPPVLELLRRRGKFGIEPCKVGEELPSGWRWRCVYTRRARTD